MRSFAEQQLGLALIDLESALERIDMAWEHAKNPFQLFDEKLMDATCDALNAWRRVRRYRKRVAEGW